MNNTINNTRKYLLDHPKLKISCEYFFNMVLTITSSFLFAYGFRSFIAPTGAEHMVSGGASGISQVLIQILLFPFPNLDSTMLQSIFYFFNKCTFIYFILVSHRKEIYYFYIYKCSISFCFYRSYSRKLDNYF